MTWSWLFYPIGEKYLGRRVRPKLRELREWMELPLAERRKLSLKHLHEILVWSQATVPYYRDLFREIHFNPDLILKSGEEFLKIPYLTKDDLREQGTRLISERSKISDLHLRKTNGSTGITTDIYYDTEFLDWSAAANLLTYDYTGRQMSRREIQLSAKSHEPLPLRDNLLETMRCAAMGRTRLHTTNFEESGLMRLLEDIQESDAYQIQGHPSTLYYLSLYVKKHGLKRSPLFNSFASTGETLTVEKSAFIEQQLGCKVYNRYGNAEFGVIAHSTTDTQSLEIFDFNVWIENRILGDGRKEIVATGLLNKAMPLIRYQTGDIGELSVIDKKPYLTKIEGRVHDLVQIGGKEFPTHFIKDHLERWGGVDEWQILARTEGRNILRIVGNHDLNESRLRSRCFEVFGNEFEIEFINLDQLRFTGWRDKFRYIVHEVPTSRDGRSQ